MGRPAFFGVPVAVHAVFFGVYDAHVEFCAEFVALEVFEQVAGLGAVDLDEVGGVFGGR